VDLEGSVVGQEAVARIGPAELPENVTVEGDGGDLASAVQTWKSRKRAGPLETQAALPCRISESVTSRICCVDEGADARPFAFEAESVVVRGVVGEWRGRKFFSVGDTQFVFDRQMQPRLVWQRVLLRKEARVATWAKLLMGWGGDWPGLIFEGGSGSGWSY